jgi:ATPase subunit of ABC transporter with duplicated ATPase domains
LRRTIAALIEGGMSVLEWLHQWNPGAADEEIRGLLGQMLFARDEANEAHRACFPAAKRRGCCSAS